MDNKIVLTVVLYNENLYDTNSYKSFIKPNKQLPLYIYDNSPVAQHVQTEFPSHICYIHDPENSGLSHAYNCAAQYAKKHSYEWMILLDQDTTFPENILQEYKSVIQNYPIIKLIAPPMSVGKNKYMSPTKLKNHFASLAVNVPSGITSLYNYSPINSGLAINTEAFLECGGYNEKVKLDFSDYQFIERFRKNYDTFYVLDTVCKQEFSNEVQTNSQKLRRFELYCNSLKNCHKQDLFDRLLYFLIITKRMLSLIIKTGKLDPIKIVITKYLL